MACFNWGQNTSTTNTHQGDKTPCSVQGGSIPFPELDTSCSKEFGKPSNLVLHGPRGKTQNQKQKPTETGLANSQRRLWPPHGSSATIHLWRGDVASISTPTRDAMKHHAVLLCRSHWPLQIAPNPHIRPIHMNCPHKPDNDR